MKKRASKFFALFFVTLLLLSVSLVLAQARGAPDAATAGGEVRSVGEWIIDFFAALIFGSTEPSDPVAVVTHIFMGLILFFLIYSIMDILGFFSNRDTTGRVFNILISFAVTMLALIALPSDFFAYILPSYGAMGAAILTMIPFLIIFMFSIRVKSIFFAQMTWVIFAIYFLGFYVLKAMKLFDSTTITDTQVTGGILYLIIGVVGFVMVFFVPVVRDFFRGGATQEAVKDINRAGTVTRALFKARKDEAQALRDMGDIDG